MIKTILDIDGMACSMCETHINNEVRNSFKIKKVISSHIKNQTVIISDAELDERKLKEVIEATGYHVLSYKCEPYEKKHFFFIRKKVNK